MVGRTNCGTRLLRGSVVQRYPRVSTDVVCWKSKARHAPAFCIHAFAFCKTTLVTAVVVCCLVTIFAIRALIYALTILGLGFSSCARLRRSDSSLVPL